MKKRNDLNNPKYTQISLYVVATVFLIYVLIQLGNHSAVILQKAGSALHTIGIILMPLIWGFVFAYLLYPLVNKADNLLQKTKHFQKKKKSTRNLAVAIVIIGVIGLIVLGLSITVSMVTREIRLINLDDITAMVSQLGSFFQGLYADLSALLDQLNIESQDLQDVLDNIIKVVGASAQEFGSNMISSLNNITGFVTNLVFALILCIYFLADAKNLMNYWDKAFKTVSPKRFYDFIHTLIRDADSVFSGYIRGQILDAVFMAVAVTIALSIVGVKFAFIIGLFTGIGNLIPYVGPIFAYGGTILSCLIYGDFSTLIVGVIVVFILQTVDGNVINPRLLSQAIEIHPMLVIIALIIGSSVGGILGMLLAVPVSGLIKLWFERIIHAIGEKRDKAPDVQEKETEISQ